MTYKELLNGIDYKGEPPQGEVTLVAQNSRKVTKGSVYVCVQGRVSDGHDYAQEATNAGAGMVVTQRALGILNEVVVEDSRGAYSLMCQNFFGHPANSLKLIGITGTNGKSTIASVLKQVLEEMGYHCGLIGTIQSEIGSLEVPAKFTTPEAWDLNALLQRMLSAGCTHVVMEASSQALEQKRLFGLRFALGVFTNLSTDHLDYHGTMENYFNAKKLLFEQCDAMLANHDDEWGERLLRETKCPVACAFSMEKDAADFVARNIDYKPAGVKFAFLGGGFLERVEFPMPGKYSVLNALAVLGAAVMLGEESKAAAEAIAKSRGVRGRCEVLHNGSFTVICDFAHTTDAIEKLLASLRPYAKKRMVVLFGCAGQRDKTKRAPMAQAVANYADEIVITADNPREESVQSTMEEALPVLKKSGKPCHVEEDREKAVRKALELLHEGDMLVLCGKGHEDYQVLQGLTVHCSEHAIVKKWLQENSVG